MDIKQTPRAPYSRVFEPLCMGVIAFLVGCTKGGDDFSTLLSDTDGGTGNASVQVTYYIPATANVVVKESASRTFAVSATGTGDLTYDWTVDGTTVGTNAASYVLSGASFSVGAHTVSVNVSDDFGSTSQSWSLKVNASPVLSVTIPTVSTVLVRQSVDVDFAVTLTDANDDALTYKWKLDGNENVLLSPTGGTPTTLARFSPGAVDVGTHTVRVEIADGSQSDEGTYVVTMNWSVVVNNFPSTCNNIDTYSLTNTTCVYAGIGNLGSEVDITSLPTSVYLRPSALAYTAAGNLFIADETHDVVFFWNRSTAPEIVLWGLTIPQNTIRVVAGTGLAAAATNSSSSLAMRQPLNDPHGLLWDEAASKLYIGDSGNNIVRMVDSTGSITTVLGGGASDVNGVAGNTHVCNSPRGMVKIGTSLYVACYSSHRVKRLDLSTGLAYLYAGTGAAGDPGTNVESSPTAGNGILRGPYGLATDGTNVFVGEYDGCRVRMVNNSGGAAVLYGALTISNGMQRIVVGGPGGANCSTQDGEPVNLTGATDTRINRPRLIVYDNNRLYLPENSGHRVTLVNYSTGALTLVSGSVTIASYRSGRIIGTGSAGYQGEGGLASNTRINTPYAIDLDPLTGDIGVADWGNYRVRNISTGDGTSELIVGAGTSRFGTAGQGSVVVTDEKYNRPRQLAYDSVNQYLFLADNSNHRIRYIDRYGVSANAVGTGASGTGQEDNDLPSASTMNDPRAVALVGATGSYGGHLVWTDSANHQVRVWNRTAGNLTIFGTYVQAGRVATLAGNGTAGNITIGSAIGVPAFNSPEGIAFDGTYLYIADTSNHCVKRLDSSGDITQVAGRCGAAGNVNGAPGPTGPGRVSNPAGLAYYSSGSSTGILIADRGNSVVKFLRLSGSGAIAGVPVSVGDANKIACGGTFHNDDINASSAVCNQVYGVTQLGTSHICFTNLNYHNVRCVNVASGYIKTVLGPLQGEDDLVPLYFPKPPLSATDQDGVTAAVTIPVGVNDVHGGTNQPLGIIGLGTDTLIFSEWGTGLLRKVKALLP